ncbi:MULTISPECIES: Zn-ribbon domain-containing OB-fold protein [unclassified Streptomyces]|uniref:Zn-ribbon domain-containing OB-fold protein n=1 Tax=unclassified Streptomyces TaxID=2593676 RepID=UPI002DDBD8C3|nr:MULTISPECIES: OB-fold domain-containing protein [unclassified Streptomyces]WSF89060.1 OB-fold domain-containing protein [Streptomyces sp. NBC_01744]WSC34770.1 OB-fold domain-containing protein [Streptomyces sp. NBC_01763]WSC43179.1 OB-fold domain-containing protein [Streptomyces sp. NBC_01762]WSC57959.1 OB-fold domain-containing protein [Streptomyces sp. NBC_01761]WSD22716.1 OB-fold domain-containing protein [Streptomyces sp. NBC_01751]
MPDVLSAPLVVEFPFTRSLGPVQSAFLTGLRERTVLGVRTGDGKVLVPPVEYDPVTAEELRELTEVATTGTVTTWAWNPAPRRGQPLATPFAWVLVKLDGADTALLHVLDAPGPEAVHTGMRVRIRWARQRTGAITDIACFEPYESEATAESTPHSGEFADPVTGIVTPARLDYTYTPGRAQSAYLNALSEQRTVGERCPSCRKVYVPPRGACPTCGVATAEQVEVGPRGTVTTYCIVNIKAKNLDIEVPYVYAHIALDGADLALHGRIGGIPYDQVRMGLRVEPVWTEGGRHPDHYRPTGEPDADYDAYKELL